MEATPIVKLEGRDLADDRVPRARSGDFAAFEGLYHRHLHRTYALCLRMTADPARAEELTQATFVRAWERLGSYRGESGFAPWLRRIAINVVLGDQRTRRRRRWKEGAMEAEPAAGGAVEPGREFDLERAIARLPEGARNVFVLHDVEGYRHEEIAAMLHVAEGTSKAQLHRARKLLREALQP